MYNFINGTRKKGQPRRINQFPIENIPRPAFIPPLPLNRDCQTFSLFSQPYLDRYNQCYKNIVVTNCHPQGPLSKYILRINFPPLSEFSTEGPCNPVKKCGLALASLANSCEIGCKGKTDNLMITDEVPNLISFLILNGYKVDTSITKMFNSSEIRFDTNTGNKLICFVTYNGN